MLRQIILLILLAVSLWSWETKSPETFFYTSVIDGDTLYVGDEKVRLAEIDAPELKQRYGVQSKRFLASLVDGKQVVMKVKNKDRYGRTVAWIMVDGQDVSEAMVKNGMAWQYMSKSSKLRSLEQQARLNRVGLWSDTNPVRPSDYRKARK